MRIVISGLPTIDVIEFVKRLETPGSTVVRDQTRAACNFYGYQTLYEMPVTLQKEIRLSLIRTHVEQLRAHNNAVFDHAVFGWLADWMRWLWSETSVREWDAALEEASKAVAMSDAIHHITKGTAAGYDGYRWLDEGNAKQIERLLRFLYTEFKCEARVVEHSA